MFLRPSASGRYCAPAAPSDPAAPLVRPHLRDIPPAKGDGSSDRLLTPTIELISVVLPVPLRPQQRPTWLSVKPHDNIRNTAPLRR